MSYATAAGRARSLSGPALFLVVWTCHALTLFGVVAAPWALLRVSLAVLAGWQIFLLLCLGHEAGHGTLASGQRFNHLLGRLCLLPALWPYAAWRFTHNRLHHGFTNLKGSDFAWAPLSAEEYARLSPAGRLLQRLYRTVPGLALYYLVECWGRYVFLRSGRHALNGRRFTLPLGDQLAVVLFVLVQVVGLVVLHTWLAGATAGLGSTLFLGLFLPRLVFAWIIGFVGFLHHTHPAIRWFDNRAEWDWFRGQLEGTVHVVFPWYVRLLIADAIMQHHAHHADPVTAFHDLSSHQQALEQAHPGLLVERWSWGYCCRLLQHCQLYDYRRHCWQRFDGTPTPVLLDAGD